MLEVWDEININMHLKVLYELYKYPFMSTYNKTIHLQRGYIETLGVGALKVSFTFYVRTNTNLILINEHTFSSTFKITKNHP